MKSYISLTCVSVAVLALSGCVSAGSADKTVELSVGQTRHLTAYRADSCGATPLSFAALAPKLPKSKIISYSDGGISSRLSKQCGRNVPTRAVNATGIAKGTETHRYQDVISIVVK
ncbi:MULTISPECIES: hypothetical protein [Agrobacterium]|jgi:hypothetical protein|uniref:Lipoprotein n=1 Tax=Agrobacterium salinitolerans TaxID=1183413 RepID=A0A9X3KTM7_9HYPH|nr:MULTISPECIES: hypothetical protein [Agrobacterium]MBA4777702.1 hypothetical protein [Hyphomicrobiales bacterium]PNQ25128.1 hypothetical protein C2E26_08360 [Rhizobium sp. YIC5082]MCZ7854987.1 hypothetical protein [Agrobacterium salinitolerans]MCZ7860353.1 hypothetical protein [Agrobacterium salinitolerans]MCZ7887384.1 hypothetical protein [Agrobacterium salinitolerans]